MSGRIFLFYTIVSFFLVLCSCGDDSDLKYLNTRETSVNQVLTQLFFVGKYGNRAGVYKYDFESAEYKIFWGTSEETVIKLSYSDDLRDIFFLTARRIGLRRGVSSIRNVKLYKIHPDGQSTQLVAEIGDAIQIHAEWINSHYSIQFTRFDLKYASYINKYNQIYSRFGKLLQEQKESFNFIEDSYPTFQIAKISLVSPSNNFGIKLRKDTVYVYAAGSSQEIYLDSTDGNIINIGWSDEERFVFFTIKQNQEQEDLFIIYVFDIIDKKIVRKFISNRKTNFYVIDDILVFDNTIENKPIIDIYNYRVNESLQSIKLYGGCGLVEIPANIN